MIILVMFLVACGQGTDQDTQGKANEANTVDSHSESESSDRDKVIQEESESEESGSSDEETETASETNAEERYTESLTDLTVHYIDAGQADATLFQYTDQEETYNILYDTGDWNANDVVNYLGSQDISSIDLIIGTHPHADHIGQLAEIVHTYDTGEVWMSGNESTSQTFQTAIEAVLSSDADYHEPRTGEEFEIGPMKIEVLHPSSISGNLNEESVSLRFTYGDVRFLFTGDAGKSDELEMMNSEMDVQADILRLGHHGSDTSSDPAFIDAVDPSTAIYSAGATNSYGHPSASVVSLIQDAGIDLYGTDVNGTIIVTTDGNDYHIETNEDGTISPESTGSSNSSDSDQSETNEANTESESTTDSCMDINDASIDEVQEITHIGPARAQDLIDLRPFDSVDDLDSINGLGPARISDIKDEGIACIGG
nr:MBL fold metallo-hydrolase [Virgibacillus natechei]